MRHIDSETYQECFRVVHEHDVGILCVPLFRACAMWKRIAAELDNRDMTYEQAVKRAQRKSHAPRPRHNVAESIVRWTIQQTIEAENAIGRTAFLCSMESINSALRELQILRVHWRMQKKQSAKGAHKIVEHITQLFVAIGAAISPSAFRP